MTSGNRVEELEAQVASLEATVKGLTEELVQANDRIRKLETVLGDEDNEIGVGKPKDDVEIADWEPATDEEEDEEKSADEDDEPWPGVEEAKADESDGDDEELDDIIVA